MYVGDKMSELMRSNTKKKQKFISKFVLILVLVFLTFFTYYQISEFINPTPKDLEVFTNDPIQMLLSNAQNYNRNRLPQNIENTEISFIPLEERVSLNSVGLLAWSGTNHQEYSEKAQHSFYYEDGFYAFGGMRHETPQDIFTIEVVNGLSYDVTVLIKLFYNYMETDFKVIGADEFKKEFILEIPARHNAHIPVTLDESLEINKSLNSRLTVATFFAPELHISDSAPSFGQFSVIDGMGLNFEIDYGTDSRTLNIPLTNLPNFPLPELATGFKINTDQFPAEASRSISVPPLLLQASPSEEIDLSLVVNGNWFLTLEEMESFLIISMLDFMQIPMSGYPFLHFLANEGQHIPFTIIAPDIPGLYEFTAVAIPNPMKPLRHSNFFPLEFTFRFTIEVLDPDFN